MKTDAFVAESNRAEFHLAPLDDAGSYDLALHTGKPESDKQTDQEISLPGYARVAVPRARSEWDVEGRVVRNARLIRFPTVTGGKAAATWLSIGIGGRIRRLIKTRDAIHLAANRRAEFEPGDIEIEETA